MDDMEKLLRVDRLRERAGVSMEEAKSALEATGWDMLEAMIYLEKQGKTSKDEKQEQEQTVYTTEAESKADDKKASGHSTSFGQTLGQFFRWCGHILQLGMQNFLVIEKDNMSPINIPITVGVILFLVCNWLLIVLFVVSLFFGFRYSFAGPNINKKADKVNETLNKAGSAAENLKSEIKNEIHKEDER